MVGETLLNRYQIEAELGTDIEEMRRNSPARHAEKVKIPVMLVHGKDDQRCPYAHFKMMLDGLKDAGTPVTSLVKDAEGHGWTITHIHLDVKVSAPGISAEQFATATGNAKAGCPVSKLFNCEITMDAVLL